MRKDGIDFYEVGVINDAFGKIVQVLAATTSGKKSIDDIIGF